MCQITKTSRRRYATPRMCMSIDGNKQVAGMFGKERNGGF